ncbi:MAG: menaquinol-cytochrome c reductase cytochrome b/c subunit [Gaiellales bacterium]|nr:menaquinol-cytochrome c reductase cytochrome b/c subunit [Gaiellales bacterium]
MARKVINRRVRYETELAASKKDGHAFFPYAMFHDVVVNLLVVVVIVAMAIIWHATAEPITAAHPQGVNGWLGALYETKANPAVQSTEPRPEWYFLFLFELLRVFKQPWQLLFATIIIPTILMVLLMAWPFIDTGRDRRLSRRPAGVALGLATPAVLIALTIAGGSAPGVGGTAITTYPALNALPGATLISEQGCTSCHNFGAIGASGPGANLGKGSPQFGDDQAKIQAWLAGGANKATGGAMPDYTGLGPDKIAEIAQLVASLKSGTVQPIQK